MNKSFWLKKKLAGEQIFAKKAILSKSLSPRTIESTHGMC